VDGALENQARPPEQRRDVELGPLLAEHAPATLRWVCDPEVSRNLGIRRTRSLAATVDWINASATDPAVHAFAIMVGGRHVGNVVLDQIDSQLGVARLSIYIGEADARGGGVGRATISLVLAEAFGRLALHKVWLIVHPGNGAAVSVYAAAGFAVEGVLRDEFLLDGERVPVLRMAVLRGEWDRRQGPA
jgi:RimJ/RimL family protein N-acetyltransferase